MTQRYKTSELSDYRSSDYLKTERDVIGYLNECLKAGGIQLFITALADVARAKGYKTIAEKTGINRVSLYKMFRPGSSPQFDSICKILGALNMQFRINGI